MIRETTIFREVRDRFIQVGVCWSQTVLFLLYSLQKNTVFLDEIRKSEDDPNLSERGGLRWMAWKLCGSKQDRLADKNFESIGAIQRLYCLWNAPVTKFWMYQVRYSDFTTLIVVSTPTKRVFDLFCGTSTTQHTYEKLAISANTRYKKVNNHG